MSGLLEALGLGAGDVVAVCGAGGKTTLARALCDDARRWGLRVALSSTTHCGRASELPLVVWDGSLDAPEREIRRAGAAQIVARLGSDGRAVGISAADAGELRRIADLVIVEADGARGRRLKAPGPGEPVLPRPCTAIVAVCSLAALGLPLEDGHVHRLPRLLHACGRTRGSPIDVEVLAAAFGPAGYGSVGERDQRRLWLASAEASPAAACAPLVDRLRSLYARIVHGELRGGVLRAVALSSLT